MVAWGNRRVVSVQRWSVVLLCLGVDVSAGGLSVGCAADDGGKRKRKKKKMSGWLGRRKKNERGGEEMGRVGG